MREFWLHRVGRIVVPKAYYALENRGELNSRLKLYCCKRLFLVETSLAIDEMLNKHNLNLVNNETSASRTWINQHGHLNKFARQLFQ